MLRRSEGSRSIEGASEGQICSHRAPITALFNMILDKLGASSTNNALHYISSIVIDWPWDPEGIHLAASFLLLLSQVLVVEFAANEHAANLRGASANLVEFGIA